MIKKSQVFFSEVKAELGKVSWPTREELVGSTAVVLVTMAIISVFIGVCDLVMTFAISHFLR